MLPSNKKVTILCILEILREYSDEDHPLTQAEIVKKLYTRYGIECERKSVGASVQSLIDFGCDIKRCGKRGCYLNARELEDSEITFLIDAVFTSKSITEKQAKEVAKKISFIQSQYKRKRYNYICKADEISRTSNKTFFYNLDIIGEAIDNGLQIMFKYNIFGANGKLNRRCEEFYTVNPYFTFVNNGKYYLVCNRAGYFELSNYKIDLITDIMLTDIYALPITKLKGYETGFDISNYINENVYMFGEKAKNITLKLYGEYAINSVIEWFGKNASIYDRDGQYFAEIKAGERGVIYWALQYGEQVEIVSPKETRDKIASLVRQISKKYEE